VYKFLTLVLLATVIYAAEATHFYVVNSASAPDSFVQSTLNYLEEAYSTYTSMGISLAPPYAGAKYLVNITGAPATSSTSATWTT